MVTAKKRATPLFRQLPKRTSRTLWPGTSDPRGALGPLLLARRRRCRLALGPIAGAVQDLLRRALRLGLLERLELRVVAHQERLQLLRVRRPLQDAAVREGDSAR